MHCPRCGQQQISEEIKFCSRCGFPLSLVSEVLAHGGFLPQLADSQCDKKWFTRNFGLKISLLWFVVLCFILTPLAAVTDAPGEAVAGLAVLGFGGALLMTLLSFLFLPNGAKTLSSGNQSANQSPQYLSGNRHQATALPPQTSQPVSDYAPPSAGSWKAPETGELVPLSVTEGTTKLLQKDE